MKPSGLLTTGFLTGGGETGNLLRSKDWSASSLGSVETWPAGLRTALSLLINSKNPMALWWGPQLLCFYNDAYLPTLGENRERGSLLGLPAKQVFAETWNVMKPAIDRVFKGETLLIENPFIPNRNEQMGDVHRAFNYSPVYDASGSVAGIFVISTPSQTEKNAETRFQLAVEAANLATWDLALDTMKLTYSSRLLEILGYRPGVVLALEEIIAHLHPDDIKVANTAYLNTLNHGQSDQEVRIVKPDKSIAWIKIQGKLVTDSDNVPTNISGSLMDVSEARISEKNTAYLAAIVQSSEDAIVSKTLDGIITSWNPAAERLFGFTASEMLHQSILTIIPEDRHAEEPLIIERIKREEPIEHFDTKRLHKSGRLIDISLSISPVKDKKGNVIGASKIARDITDRVEAAKKIKESSERLQLAIEATHLGIWDYSLLTGKLNWSQDCKKIFGVSDSVKIDRDFLLKFIHPDDKELIESAIRRSLDPEGTGAFDISCRIFRQHDKSVRSIRMQGSVRFNEQLQAEGLIGTVLDITEQKQVQQALEEIEERNRLAIDAADMGTFDWNLITQEFISSPRLNHIFGYQGLSNVDHQQLINAFLPEDRPVRDKAVNESAAKGSLSYEARIMWPDKSIHWVRVYGKIVYDERQTALRMYGTVLDVTEEKTILTALRESENRLNIAIQTAELGTWELNLKTREISCSKRFHEIMRSDKKDAPSFETLLSKLYADETKDDNYAINKAMEAGIVDHETCLGIEGHDIRWIKVKGKVFYDQQNFPEKILGTVMDITQQKMAFENLKKTEERFRLLANFMPQFVWTGDVTGNLNYFNDAIYDFTGSDKEEMQTGGWLQIVHPDDCEFTIKSWLFSVETGKDFSLEHRFRRKDGQYRWQLSRAIPFRGADNKIQIWIGTSTDIHDQKSFSERLQKSELLFKTISNASPVGLWMTDIYGQNTFVNDTWISWTGVPLEKQYEEGWMDRIIEEDKIPLRARFMECMQKRERYSAEFRIIRNSGDLRWCFTEGSPYYDINGEYSGYAGSVTDITDRKMIEEDLENKVEERTRELNVVNRALEKSNDELEEFAYVASHDLQEPLRKIKTFVSRLQETNEDMTGKPGAIYMEKIVSATARMSDLISDLLEYSRITKISEQRAETDLNLIVKNVLEDFELMILQKKAVIKTSKLPVINAVPHQMSQLFSNLINNSLKFSMEGRAPVIVITSNILSQEETTRHNLQPGQLYNEIILEDNGIGFSNEFSEKIFEIFQRLNARSSYGGWGIGLSICRKIVLNHNGLIFADSIEGEVTRFHVILPVEKEKQRNETSNHQTAQER